MRILVFLLLKITIPVYMISVLVVLELVVGLMVAVVFTVWFVAAESAVFGR